jgi:hypothetical protein
MSKIQYCKSLNNETTILDEKQQQESTTNSDLKIEKSSDILASSLDLKKTSATTTTAIKNPDNFCVLLHHWIQTEQVLQDTCRDFLPKEESEKFNVKKLISSIASEGFCVLKGGSKDQCRNLAKALVNLGATTTVVLEVC